MPASFESHLVLINTPRFYPPSPILLHHTAVPFLEKSQPAAKQPASSASLSWTHLPLTPANLDVSHDELINLVPHFMHLYFQLSLVPNQNAFIFLHSGYSKKEF